jgi:hypothetical protein
MIKHTRIPENYVFGVDSFFVKKKVLTRINLLPEHLPEEFSLNYIEKRIKGLYYEVFH